MVQLGIHRIAAAVLRNQAHRLFGGIRRGGHRTTTWAHEALLAHGKSIHENLRPHIGNHSGHVGLEIGPGDNLEVCHQFLYSGCSRMIAVERYAAPKARDPRVKVINSTIEEMSLSGVADFAYSHDVFEHVADVPAAMRSIYAALKPGGRFVSSIDLRGHNAFNKPDRPLDFLSCPDWLWKLMFSHIATTNRVRAHEFKKMAKDAGFIIRKAAPLEIADPAYVDAIHPKMTSKYQGLPKGELSILQLLLVVERPA